MRLFACSAFLLNGVHFTLEAKAVLAKDKGDARKIFDHSLRFVVSSPLTRVVGYDIYEIPADLICEALEGTGENLYVATVAGLRVQEDHFQIEVTSLPLITASALAARGNGLIEGARRWSSGGGWQARCEVWEVPEKELTKAYAGLEK